VVLTCFRKRSTWRRLPYWSANLNGLRKALVAAGIIGVSGGFAFSAGLFMLLGFTGRVVDWHSITWSRVVARIAGMKLRATGGENVDLAKAFVLVANHRSHLDTNILFIGAPVPIRMLAKASLFKIPIFGWAMGLAGHVPVHRDKGATDMDQLAKDVDRLILGAGRSLCVFPEGTRQPAGEFGSYKKGAFIMAAKLGLPILPVSIEDSARILPAKTLVVEGGEVRIHFHPVIEVIGKTPDELCAETKRIVEEGCLKLREEKTPA
jgi:1-acyl-sn-glycerol-3-phosphate acyltransferase